VFPVRCIREDRSNYRLRIQHKLNHDIDIDALGRHNRREMCSGTYKMRRMRFSSVGIRSTVLFADFGVLLDNELSMKKHVSKEQVYVYVLLNSTCVD
jgi:hypothetical protein